MEIRASASMSDCAGGLGFAGAWRAICVILRRCATRAFAAVAEAGALQVILRRASCSGVAQEDPAEGAARRNPGVGTHGRLHDGEGVRGLLAAAGGAAAGGPVRGGAAQVQADRATIWRVRDRLSVFVVKLGRNRAAQTECATDERVKTLMACHEHVFLAFFASTCLKNMTLYIQMRWYLVNKLYDLNATSII